MIRTIMGVLAGLAAPSTLAAGIAFFEGSWDEALQKAEETGQLVFVDVYTEWCGPCKLMDANVYPTDAVGDYFNPRFVNVKLDAKDEDVDGPEIADRYDIGAYPTLLFLNPDGSELGRGVAGLEVEQLIQLARELTGAGTSEYAAMRARFDAGERDGAFVQDFLKTAQIEAAKLYGDFEAMRSHRQRMTPVFDAYFETKDKKALINATDFSVIASYKSKQQRGDRAVEFVIDNYDAFAAVAPENALVAFVLESNYYTAQALALAGDEGYLKQLDMLNEDPLRKAAEFERSLDADSSLLRKSQEELFRPRFLARSGRWTELQENVEARLAKPDANQARIYASAANDFLRAEEEEFRQLAHEYAKRGYELDQSNPFAAMSYSRSLAQYDQTAEAIAVLEEALGNLTAETNNFTDALTAQLAHLKEQTSD